MFFLLKTSYQTKMDIDQALNEIIFKYHLDRCYPHYRNMYEAEKILKDVINDIIQNNKSAIFVGDDMTGIDFVRNISRNYDDICFQFHNRRETELLENIDWKAYDEVYLISFYGAEYIEKWFRMHSICYEWIYDIFERKGVFCEREFYAFGKENLVPLVGPGVRTHVANGYRYTEALQCELYCQHSKYEYSDDFQTKRIALEKCLFLSVYMRNFVSAEKYVLLLINYDEKFERMWKEIQDLLDTIKVNLNHRNQKDIVVYWLDCIPYGEEKGMLYLQKIKQDAIVFENAYVNIGFTSSTLRAMFIGKRDIEDRVCHIIDITRENSDVIRFLEAQGYNVKIISGMLNGRLPIEYSSARFYPIDLAPCSMKLWDMAADMLLEEGKTLYVIHMMDSHSPYLNSRMKDSDYKAGEVRKERYRCSRTEMDEQLAFYDSMVNEEVYRIYMSDHGRTEIDRHHILFNIYHRALKPRRIEKMFSILDFGTILKQIIVNEAIDESEFIREYVAIGNMDWYAKYNIENLLRKKDALTLAHIGYTGIIDKNYVYLRYKTGREWLHKIEDLSLYKPLLFYDCPDDICQPELLSKYRELVGDYPEDLIETEMFRYSQYLYKLYENMLQHNNVPERVALINQMLTNYPDGSVAIRMGGVTSVMLYYILSVDSRRKIWGFIDHDEDCLCGGIQLPIISSKKISDMPDLGVKAVILPSYTHLKMLREECKGYPDSIDVLDIYDVFDRNGIRCQEDFYKMRGTDEDYDVGFPFEEMKK